MTCEGKIYVGQIGVLFRVDTQGVGCPDVDWSSATVSQIICKRPDGEITEWDATINGSYFEYTTISENDLPLSGTYKIQTRVVGPSYEAYGETTYFQVDKRWY